MAAVETRRSGSDAVTTTTHDLYRRYGRQIYAYCLHKLRSKEEAEDAVQTTFLNAFRSLQRGTTMEYEQAWLYKIAHNVCLERSTSSARRLRLETPNDLDMIEDLMPSRRDEGALELMGIEEALESMPENQRRAILLREWQGLSYREIGEQLQLSQAAVEMLIFRARRTLAGALEQPAEQKRRRAGRGALLASLLGGLKALFGGGAAIKAIGAAAAVVVVGESAAQHTIVQQRSSLRPVRQIATAVAHVQRQQAPARVQAPVVTTRRAIQSHLPASRPAAVVKKLPAVRQAPVARRPAPAAPAPAPAPAPVAAPAPAPAPVAAAAPAPPVDRQTAAVPPPAPAPAPAPPAPVEQPAPLAETPVTVPAPVVPPAPTPAPAPPAPQPAPQPQQQQQPADKNPDSPGNGHAYGRDRDSSGKPGKPDKP
ncbi:MAG TPA: sigma-70 family RNA polymerase sigma factor [Gaiellaceae bacterium]|nr:sigma-70 family RNA polymerase sigma factor [Gaiellaceae bacterium]